MSPPDASSATVVFLHTSDEHYGADRILLDLFEALPTDRRDTAEFWLPTDLPHGTSPLCVELERRGARVRHLDLPVLRRSYRTPRRLLALVGRSRALLRELRRTRPELVYCTTSAAFLGVPIARRAGVPRVLGHVQEVWSGSDRRVLGLLARRTDRLVAISEAVKSSLPPSLQGRTWVVVNATPAPTRFVPLDGRSGPLRFVCASRWNGWKGHRTLLAAWDRLESPGELVILGGPPAAGEVVDVPALVRGLRRPETVRIVGEVPDADAYLEEADVVVVPSDRPEPFGLVAIEAFARGRPVVCSEAGGLVDIVSDGLDGWFFPLADVPALGDLLGRLTREQVTEAGARARATYETDYTAGRYARDWLEVTGIAGVSP